MFDVLHDDDVDDDSFHDDDDDDLLLKLTLMLMIPMTVSRIMLLTPRPQTPRQS